MDAKLFSCFDSPGSPALTRPGRTRLGVKLNHVWVAGVVKNAQLCVKPTRKTIVLETQQ